MTRSGMRRVQWVSVVVHGGAFTWSPTPGDAITQDTVPQLRYPFFVAAAEFYSGVSERENKL